MKEKKSAIKKLENIDNKIKDLLNQRISLFKDTFFDCPEIEFSDNKTKIPPKNKFPITAMKLIFNEMQSACCNAIKPLKVCYLGPEGTFTNLAAIKQFGTSAQLSPATTISDVFKMVENGKEDFGVVPIENSTEGMVTHTLDMFQLCSVYIHSEFYIPIHLCLTSAEKDIKKIKTIFSHPQPLAQCRTFLETNFHKIKLIETSSTSEAAKIAKHKKNAAAITSIIAKNKYKLHSLAKNIEDSNDNTTRFIVISKKPLQKKYKHSKTSLLFSLKDKPGSLTEILNILSTNKVNMKKIQSRPSKSKTSEYTFFIDIDGDQMKNSVKLSLIQIEEKTTFLKILGSYPAQPNQLPL